MDLLLHSVYWVPWNRISKRYLIRCSYAISLLKWPRCNLPPQHHIWACFKPIPTFTIYEDHKKISLSSIYHFRSEIWSIPLLKTSHGLKLYFETPSFSLMASLSCSFQRSTSGVGPCEISPMFVERIWKGM